MAENDTKNDNLFELRFWQLDMAQASAVTETIRGIDASEISSNRSKYAKYDRLIWGVKKAAVTFPARAIMSVEKKSGRR